MSDTNPETAQPQSDFDPKRRPDAEGGGKTHTEGQSIGSEGRTSEEDYSDKTGAPGGSGEAGKAPAKPD